MNRGTVPDVIVMNDNDDKNGWSDLIKWDRETSVMIMMIKLVLKVKLGSWDGATCYKAQGFGECRELNFGERIK